MPISEYKGVFQTPHSFKTENGASYTSKEVDQSTIIRRSTLNHNHTNPSI